MASGDSKEGQNSYVDKNDFDVDEGFLTSQKTYSYDEELVCSPESSHGEACGHDVKVNGATVNSEARINDDPITQNKASPPLRAENQLNESNDTENTRECLELSQSTINSSQQESNENCDTNSCIDNHMDIRLETSSESETYMDVPEEIKFCDFCSAENIDMMAVSFCPECVDYLCEGCNRFHSRCKLTKHHVVREHIPTDNIMYKRIANLLSCPQHPDMKVTYVCNDHKKNVCVTCVVESHRKCEKVQKLSEFVKAGICETGDLIKDTENHQLLISTFAQRKSDNIEDIQTEKEEILLCLEEKVETVIATVLKMKAATENEIHENAARQISSLQREKKLCEEMEHKIQMYKEVLEFLLENGGDTNEQVLRHVIWGKINQNQKSLSRMKNKSKHIHFIKNESEIGIEKFGEVKVYTIDDEAETDDVATDMNNLPVNFDTTFESSGNLSKNQKPPLPSLTKPEEAIQMKTFPDNSEITFGDFGNMPRDVKSPSPSLTRIDVATNTNKISKDSCTTLGVSKNIPVDNSALPAPLPEKKVISYSYPKTPQQHVTLTPVLTNTLTNVKKSVPSMVALSDWFDTDKNKAALEARKCTPEVGNHLVKLDSDLMVCSISKCVVLNNGSVVLIDDNNKKMKRFYDNFKGYTTMPLDAYVNDMCLLKNDEFALLYNDLHKIVVYSLSKNKFVVSRSTSVQRNHEFKSIAADDVNERLALIYGLNVSGGSKTYDCIQIRSFSGKVICDFKLESLIGLDIEKPLTSRNCGLLFTSKGLIVVCFEHGISYIPQTTDAGELVLSKAKQLYSFRDNEMIGMTNRVSDAQGNIYVCTTNSGGCVHRYEKSFNYNPKRVVSGIFIPLCMGVLSQKKLIVGCQNDNFVHVYNI